MPDPQTLPYAFGGPPVKGRLRVRPEDFQVDEDLGFEPSGDGEHALLQIRKRNANTQWVATRLAEFAGVRPVAVGYAGLKDRRAVTTQWFSVQLPGREDPSWQDLGEEGVEVLQAQRHGRKLRPGSLRGNRFAILVRDVEGAGEDLEARLRTIADAGVPNYFGAQRFGRNASNLERAQALFDGRRLGRRDRAMALSAARSWLFNLVLAERVEQGTWDRPLPGDLVMLDGSHSIFPAQEPDALLESRCAAHDLHPTGPLWGRGEPGTSGECRALEEGVLASWAHWRAGLERAGLRQERRALRAPVRDLRWDVPEAGSLRLQFSLDRGSYATAVLRELVREAEADDPGQ